MVLGSPDLSPAMIQENLLRGDDPDHFVEGTSTAPIAPDVHAQKSEAIVRLSLAQRTGPGLSVGFFHGGQRPNGGALRTVHRPGTAIHDKGSPSIFQ